MDLGERLELLNIGLTGDRINLVSKPGLFIAPYEMAFGNPLIGMGIFLCSTFAFSITTGGAGTYRSYKRTKKHIQKFRKLDSRFAKRLMNCKENGRFIGYCSLQGMYLASKKYGELNSFYEFKNKYSKNLLPNF